MIVETELPDHPDYQMLKRVVGEYAMEALIRIWGHCQSNKRGERWTGRGADYLEVVAKWEGERGALFRALKDYGWIEVHGEDVVIHNWEMKNSCLLASRKNGKLGGRPRKPEEKRTEKPTGLAQVTTPKPTGLAQENGGSTDHSENPQVKRGLTQHEPSPNPALTQPVVSHLISSNPSGGLGDFYDMADQRIALLNLLTGSKFNPPLYELDQIVARLKETDGDFAGVDLMLRRQVALWKDDPKSRQWLKPGTLFGVNFHDYYGQRALPAGKNAPPGFRKNQNPGGDRTELLETLAATRQQLDKNPDDSALAERVRELELQTT